MARNTVTDGAEAVDETSKALLDHEQIVKASRALLQHIKSQRTSQQAPDSKQNLLGTDDEDGSSNSDLIWLVVATKKHIVDKARLKPGKLPVPHSLNASEELRICLITSDPQRAFKEAITHPSFPPQLGKKITRVIGEDKVRKKYKSFESRRKLFGEHDLFLADDRIIVHLPHLLGKVFYKSRAKRPIPITISAKKQKVDGRVKTKQTKETTTIAPPLAVAAEIERALSTTLIHLATSSSTSVSIGMAGWDEDKIVANIEAVVPRIVEKYVPQKQKGLKALHIKGQATAALPIFLADQLWTDENDILEHGGPEEVDVTQQNGESDSKPAKRKITDDSSTHKSKKKAKSAGESTAEIAIKQKKSRKEDRRKQKEGVLQGLDS